MLSEHHQMGQITVMTAAKPDFRGSPAIRVANDIVDAYARKIRGVIEYWVDCADRVREFLDKRLADRGEVAVYGAGVFGSYLAMNAGSAEKDIVCVLDQNPFKIGKQHMGRPIIHPRDLPRAVATFSSGSIPRERGAILQQAGLWSRQIMQFFLP